MVTIVKCPCGHAHCNYYGVSNGSFFQGCGWGKNTAVFVAWCFNSKVVKAWWKVISWGLPE